MKSRTLAFCPFNMSKPHKHDLGFVHFPFNFLSFIILNPIITMLTFKTINLIQQIVMVWTFATLQVVLLGGFTPKKAYLEEFPSPFCLNFTARCRKKGVTAACLNPPNNRHVFPSYRASKRYG